MAGMAADYLDAIANHGRTLITHIGLVDGSGDELGGGDPAYARVPCFWTTASGGNGTIRPWANEGHNEDLVFNVPGSTTVGGWRGFSNGTLGSGTNYGGKDLDNETFTNQGEYRLLGAQTGIIHSVPGT